MTLNTDIPMACESLRSGCFPCQEQIVGVSLQALAEELARGWSGVPTVHQGLLLAGVAFSIVLTG